MSSTSLATALQTLATYRSSNTRKSQDTFAKGVIVLKSGKANGLGVEGWAFLEQLALAAIDVGRFDVADECIHLLQSKFPGSPRVDTLEGIRVESTSTPDVAIKYYRALLDADSAHGPAWKRLISVLRQTGDIERTVSELLEYLDTFYTDVEGWLELADTYATSGQYTSSLQALSHALVLAPQNPFFLLQAGETAYTAGDVSLALKYLLGVVDMVTYDDQLEDKVPQGIEVRAWWGIKLCTRRLTNPSTIKSQSIVETPITPKNLALLDDLATERLRVAYSSGVGPDGAIAQGREGVFNWVA